MKLHSPVVALFIADVHLSVKPPIARSDEPSWFGAMERSLKQLRNLQAQHPNAIVLCAGDIFDRWNSPPELINWALERLPHLHAIPGNHDLPNHRPELAYRSAYGTLVRAGRVTELGGWPVYSNSLAIYGRPFGEEVPKIRKEADGQGVRVLVTHEYLWTTGSGYLGAPEESRLSNVAKSFRGFDVVIVGDNHIPFERVVKGGTQVVNCGGFFRRKATERDHKPRVGLIHASGAVSFVHLDCAEDKLSDRGEGDLAKVLGQESEEGWMADYVASMKELESTELDFADNIQRALRESKARPEVKKLVLEAMETT